MTGKAWRTRRVSPGTTVQSLKINSDYWISVEFAHAEDDVNCAAPLSARMTLKFTPMRQVVLDRTVMFGHEDWDPAERCLRCRRQALSYARQWQRYMQKSIRKLRLPLKDAEP